MRRAGELSGGREEQIQAETGNEGMTGADLLSLYLEELKQIPALEAEEEAALLEKLRAGDARARKRLTEGYLGTALAEIQPFVGSMEAGELIGVANLALTAALCDEKILESTVLRDTIKQKVHTALEEAVRENRQSDTGEQTLADRMNALTELSSELAAELGREASPEELAARLDIPLDEVQRLLAMSMQALE
ncbi:sigma-70 domain-containing protein [Stomatobaculum longum]|uniref:sigma-70 domain-containing protein n=1 Tax=Stomatobaculum longum TaxID=796942 RepID=UPI0028E554E7|nr:sigma-70 domain-containing protein [Stomatobaculum longum]